MRAILFAIVAVVIFTIFVTVFAAAAPASRVRVLPKWVWVLLCVISTPLGGILYLTLGRPLYGTDGSNGNGAYSGSSTGSGGGSRKSRTLAPDDDPDFLRNLAKRLKNINLDDDQGNQPGDNGNQGNQTDGPNGKGNE